MVITAVIQAALEVHSALPRLFPNRPDHLNVELPRFRGYFLTWEKGVHDAEESRAIPGGVWTADGRVGALAADAGGVGGEV